ncbi:MAG: ErpK protein [Peptostreptococcaceae bacterium]|nr:ErpK protein [Peptostreptococcaceae bacterium]
MARTKQNISIDEKIEKAQDAAEKTKEKYDMAVKEPRSLMEKKEAMKKQELFKAIENSRKSYEGILNFLMADGAGE